MGPCKNPNCKSRGLEHPNCRCYPERMADGGEVGASVCDGPHNIDCEHYTDRVASDDDDTAASFAHTGFGGMISNVDVAKHVANVRRGHERIDAGIDSLFNGEHPSSAPDEKARERIHKYLGNGGITQSFKEAAQPEEERFAKGGLVEKHHKTVAPILGDTTIAAHSPVQNVLLQAHKAQTANYLNSLRPQENAIKLPFDDEPDDTQQRRAYHQAVDLSHNPLSILGEIGRGTLEMDHVKHLSSMSPGLNDLLQRRLTEKITKHQLDGKKPPYKMRQALSLFMGSPLSSEMTPGNIQAVQATFAAAKAQPKGDAPQTTPKKNTATLTKADEAFLTGLQARQKRDQR